MADQYQKYISTGSHRVTYQRFIKHIVPQPLAAYIGLLGCILLVITSSAVWWDQSASQVSLAWSISVYLLVSCATSSSTLFRSARWAIVNLWPQEVLLLLFWAGLKFRNRELRTWWVRQDEDISHPTELISRIDKLFTASEKGERRTEIELGLRQEQPGAEDTRSYSVQVYGRR